MDNILGLALILALIPSWLSAAEQAKPDPPKEVPAKVVAPEDMKKLLSQVGDLIAPFTVEDAKNGFKNETDLWNLWSQPKQAGMLTNFTSRTVKGQRIGDFVVDDSGKPKIENLWVTKSRPDGGNISLEISLQDGNIEHISFALLPAKVGWSDIWGAKPTVELSKRLSPSSDLGFQILEIRQGDIDTRYELPGDK
jgi:hypothetical protein